ncbi:MAG: DUF72 domain-containing protein [Phycisphaerae bacterium]
MPDEQLAFGWGQEPEKPSSSRPRQSIRPLADRLQGLARRGIYLGTSSWKYPGWLGQVYDPGRYQTRGRLSQKKFERECLSEYATIFPTVGGDFSFYQFPSEAMWERCFSQVPEGFRFSVKIPEDITVERFPKLPRYGRRAGRENPNFMDPRLLEDRFLAPLEPYRKKLGVLMFEFGAIHDGPMKDAAQFADALNQFLSRLPTDRFDFAVEVRNRSFLTESSDYLDCLRSNGVAHCFNSWTRMPSIIEQLAISGTFTAKHAVARLLLKPGRAYRDAVKQFSPYERIQEPYPEGRAGLMELIETCLDRRLALFAFVNNRFEGNAVETIREVAVGAGG